MNAKCTIAAFTTLISLLSAPGYSAVLYDSHGFEAPLFGLGSLENQDSLNGPWQALGSGGSATVVNGAPGNSSQVLQFDREGGDYFMGIVKPTGPLTEPGSANVRVEWTMSYSSSTATMFGPYFAVSVWGEDMNGFPLLAASAGLDAYTGEVLYQAPGTGYITATELAVPPDTWLEFALALDYSTQSYDLYVNGAALLSGSPFVDSGITGLNDVTIAGLAGGWEDLEAYGTAYFDEFRISTVPDAGETAAYLAFTLAGLALFRRRTA